MKVRPQRCGCDLYRMSSFYLAFRLEQSGEFTSLAYSFNSKRNHPMALQKMRRLPHQTPTRHHQHRSLHPIHQPLHHWHQPDHPRRPTPPRTRLPTNHRRHRRRTGSLQRHQKMLANHPHPTLPRPRPTRGTPTHHQPTTHRRRTSNLPTRPEPHQHHHTRPRRTMGRTTPRLRHHLPSLDERKNPHQRPRNRHLDNNLDTPQRPQGLQQSQPPLAVRWGCPQMVDT